MKIVENPFDDDIQSGRQSDNNNDDDDGSDSVGSRYAAAKNEDNLKSNEVHLCVCN